ncbi:MAG TPA: helix-hairpin-helix domain-containing protein [Pirellulales bacterium]|nr:helix-hairpin-helix domain-containing protein [Pirellulales bacterium]
MSTHRTQPPKPPHPWLLRRADQAAVAGLALTALVTLACYWTVHGGWRRRLIEIDREPPHEATFLVDLNAARWAELAQLPGIGEGLARRIVESRERDGPFVDQDDLRRVRGIGPKTMEQLRPYLRPMPPADNVAGP